MNVSLLGISRKDNRNLKRPKSLKKLMGSLRREQESKLEPLVDIRREHDEMCLHMFFW